MAFKKGDYESAIQHYTAANEIEPEMPHYQLNLAAAHLKLNRYACTPLLLLAYAPLIDNVASIFSLFARTFFFAVLPFASSHVDGWKPKLRATRP